MEGIRRIRPQGKRKALRAKHFYERYLLAAHHAAENRDQPEAERMMDKAAYWRSRYERYAHHV